MRRLLLGLGFAAMVVGTGRTQAPARNEPAAVTAPAATAPAGGGPAAAAPVAGTPVVAPPPTGGTQATSDTAAPEPRAVAVTPAGSGHDLSPITMFMGADVLVKAVMVGLALASLLTWTIFIGKLAELGMMKRRLRTALQRLGECRSLQEAESRLGGGRDALATLIRDTTEEVRLSQGIAGEAGLKERVASLSADILRVEGRAVRRGLGLLATIGSISPFVGLFGTVWGIMNSFIGIAKSNTTNLAVVAPGIAEALLATAIGLVAAIPAVIIYNHFARSTKGYLELVTRASGAVSRLLSRDLDRSRTRVFAQAAE